MKINFLTLNAFLYIFLLVLLFLSPIKTPVVEFLPGVLFLLFVFAVFLAGFFSAGMPIKGSRILLASSSYCKRNRAAHYFFLTVLSILFSLVSIKFYTGLGFSEVLHSLGSGQSNYNNYQQYFSENLIGIGIGGRIVGILSLFLLKAIMVFLIFDIFLISKRYSLFKLFCLLIVVFSYFIFSVARGTSFELFEILLLFFFVFFMRQDRSIFRTIDLKSLLGLFVFLSSIVVIYSANIAKRYGGANVDLCISSVVCYDDSALLSIILPGFSALLVKLSAYFTFPIYYMSVWLESVLFLDFERFLMLSTPMSYFYSDVNVASLCYENVDCGASWSPLIEKLILNLGFLTVVMLVYCLGFTASIILNKGYFLGFYDYVYLYFVFLFMLSLVVNDFIFSVSSNFIMFSISFFYLLTRFILIRRD